MIKLLPFRLSAFLAVLSIIFILNGCSSGSSKTDEPVPATGIIIGKINPKGGASSVTAYMGNNGYTVTPDTAGKFKITNVIPGVYTVFTANVYGYDYPVPYSLSATVTANNVADVGTFVMPLSQLGRLDFTIDNGTYGVSGKPYVTCNYTSPNLNISAVGNPEGTPVTLSIALDNITGVGQYNIGHTSTSNMRVSQGKTNPNVWSTLNGGSAYVIITELNIAENKISGTFAASALVPESNATGNKVVSRASFTNLRSIK